VIGIFAGAFSWALFSEDVSDLESVLSAVSFFELLSVEA